MLWDTEGGSNATWLEFNGAKSTDLGVRVTDSHSFSRGTARGDQAEVSGRDGYLWLSDGAAEAFEIKCACLAPASKLREVSVWLSGAGGLRFSAEPGAMYDARLIKAIEFKRAAPGADPLYKFTATFSCQPFPRVWPEAEPIEIAASGTPLQNPGTAPSLPRIEIAGSGAFSLTIGMQTMFFTNVEGGIIVDSELMDALTADGSLLANDRVSGDFFEIQPGQNVVQWIEGGIDEEDESVPGSVERVVITPRWRCM